MPIRARQKGRPMIDRGLDNISPKAQNRERRPLMRTSAFLYGALLAIAATPAPAQNPSPPQSGDEIIVQGTRPTKRQVSDFVKALTRDVPLTGQIGRFLTPVCPVSLGLSPAQNGAVVARMRRVASAAGVETAPVPCTPNAFVIVAADKSAGIEALHHKYPAYFAGLSRDDVRDLAKSGAPAAAWQVKGLQTADGQPLNKAGGWDYYVVEGTFDVSRLKSASVPTFVASVVMIDLDSADGLTVTQLADYAAMRTFAAADPDKVMKTGAPSILTVLGQPDDRPLPITITYWDLGFLKALYATSNAYYSNRRRHEMENVVKKELQHSGESPRQ